MMVSICLFGMAMARFLRGVKIDDITCWHRAGDSADGGLQSSSRLIKASDMKHGGLLNITSHHNVVESVVCGNSCLLSRGSMSGSVHHG